MKRRVVLVAVALITSACGDDDTEPGAPEFTQSEELFYDDGAGEEVNSPWGDEVGWQIAVCFEAPGHPMRADTARFFVPNYGQTSTPFGVRLYAQATAGAPGDSILSANVTAAAEDGSHGWVDVALTAHNIIVAEGDFCVAMEWTTPAGDQGQDAQFLNIDDSEPDGRTFWGNPTDGWTPIEQIGSGADRDAMIRAVVAF